MATRTTDRPKWSRVVLKLSGEALAESVGFGLDGSVLQQVAEEIKQARSQLGVDIAIVVGGGNFWRGIKGAGQALTQRHEVLRQMLKRARLAKVHRRLPQLGAEHPG